MEKSAVKKSRSAKDQAAGSLKAPPHSQEAEQSVLGGLLLDNTAWDSVADRVAEVDFYSSANKTIFRAVEDLAERGKPIDGVTLTEWLDSNQELDNIGGVPYIAMLVNNTPTVANIAHYADIVREHSILRQLIKVANEIGDLAFSPEGKEVAEILDESEAKVFEIADQGAKSRMGFEKLATVIPRIIERLELLNESDSHIIGMPTGFKDLDRKTSGLQKSDLIIVAGRPSMGKTAFAMNLVENVALEAKKPVAVFSMEMPSEQLLMRMLSSLSQVSGQSVRTGQLSAEDWPRIFSTTSLLNSAPVFVDDTPALTPSELRARVRRLKREQGDLGLVVIDYIQLMRASSEKENRATELSEISRNLKALAKEMDVPVVALSQLNRSLEQRTDKRPIMSDLRESGAIEQDADIIMFVYRDEVYNEETTNDKGVAEIIIGKQRNGPIGTVKLAFRGEFVRFDDLAPEYYMGADKAEEPPDFH